MDDRIPIAAEALSNLNEDQMEALREYFAESDDESAEALSTSEEEEDYEDEDDSEESSDADSIAAAFDAIALHDLENPSDIESDDSAFSSDDEYAEDSDIEEQQVWRDMVLGHVKATTLVREHDLVQMHEDYMMQLYFADEELAELNGTKYVEIMRRQDSSPRVRASQILRGRDMDEVVRQLRMRSKREVRTTPPALLARGAVILAQTLFRTERKIKNLYVRDPEDETSSTSTSDQSTDNEENVGRGIMTTDEEWSAEDEESIQDAQVVENALGGAGNRRRVEADPDEMMVTDGTQ
ncbi:uncharacterized protein LAESUDRAFT_731383 [Laetiporus sulphureus 93-53]|uniref:Uncharacterized protein n=1 Tax=Laetiporus sulphureus 93-53 TaxID=1314785 RepID=A0A165BM22_9APHY|nr:uncharacterized protein LAESUDRAFT_731383 [Laetiporus sulphureus 93-53]KZT01293.1 hypothetical protein LAESUDRAFT_731383 [Laetiporus sulphureus 93-53]